MKGHHSLVTPIDWKQLPAGCGGSISRRGHHSLVTPIDWKPEERSTEQQQPSKAPRHHSLVTPIDWKPRQAGDVAPQAADIGHHSLVTPIDWKPASATRGLETSS